MTLHVSSVRKNSNELILLLYELCNSCKGIVNPSKLKRPKLKL